jgi:hypothetical protein
MDTLNKDFINELLIGIDYNHTVMAYTTRDKVMNLVPNEQILYSLQKLGYYNVNFVEETKSFIIDNVCKKIKVDLSNDWEASLKYEQIYGIMEGFKETDIFKNFLNKLNVRLGRALVLSKFIGSNENEKFYNSLTLEELNYLGY